MYTALLLLLLLLLLLQVREAAGLPPITQMQVEAKKLALHQASHYQYSEEDARPHAIRVRATFGTPLAHP